MRTFVYTSFHGSYPLGAGLLGPGTNTRSFKEMNEVGLPPPGEEDGRAANLEADKDALAPLQVLGALPSAPSPRVSPCPRYYGNARDHAETSAANPPSPPQLQRPSILVHARSCQIYPSSQFVSLEYFKEKPRGHITLATHASGCVSGR